MKSMIVASLLLNVIVLVPVVWGMATAAEWAQDAFGGETGARAILLAIYGAILLLSCGLLIKPIPAVVAGMLALQIAYKVATPFTVGRFDHPVVMSNLAIAAIHAVTLFLIVQSGQLRSPHSPLP